VADPDGGTGDAGAADGGLAYTPIVGADGGEMSLAILPEPGSSCAGLMPPPVDPVVTAIDVSPRRYFFWGETTTDGRGNLLLNVGTDPANYYAKPSADGGIDILSYSGAAVPEADGFLLYGVTQGACLICDSRLFSWPAGNSIPMGNGYAFSQNCDFAARAERDGAYVSCVGPLTQGAPPTFARFDAQLQRLWSLSGDGNFVLAADANDKLLERDASNRWRWVDESLTPLSDWFPGARFSPQLLIGGGFLDGDLRFIPSGSAAVTAAPQWLAARPGVSIVLGGRAYGLVANDCTVEIRDPAGALCGTVTIENCREAPWPGHDGTITILKDPVVGAASRATYVSWPRLLR
jgi:hypothetical protein